MLRRVLFGNRDAVSVAVSAVLVLMISTSTVGTVLYVGVETVETLNEENSGSNIEMQLSSVSENLKKLTNSRSGDSKLIKFGMDKDVSLTLDPEIDRTILMYTVDPNYEFTVSGLDDGDSDFDILMQYGDITEVKIFWLDFFDTCFLAGTKVLMADNSYKNIEDVNLGDFVKSYNEITGLIQDCKVVDVFHHQPDEMPDFYLVINDYLKGTPNHRFYSNGEWIFAGDLKVGDLLFDYNQEEYFIYSIEKIYTRVPTYDLEIEVCHTYFVSINNNVDVLVHNDFSLPGSLEARTDDEEMVTTSSARLNGYLVGDGNDDCAVVLRHRVSGVENPWLPCMWSGYTYRAGESFQRDITFLNPNTAYDFQAGAKNSGGEHWGEIKTFTTNSPPDAPSDPTPANGAIDITADTDLSWYCSDPDPGDTLFYDVYFEADDSTPDVLVSEHQTSSSYDPGNMDDATLYYWKIVAWDNHGASKVGPIWSFTTIEGNNLPETPNSPHPADGATGIGIGGDLSWTCSDPDDDTLTYDVYFGTSTSPPIVKTGQSVTTYDLGTISFGTTYYWKIVAEDEHGATSTGPIWSFTTFANYPPSIPTDPPSGPNSIIIYQDVGFITNSTDPDGNQIRYGWDWNSDGLVDDWTDLVDSGQEVTTVHSWDSIGTYSVKVKVKDAHGAMSGWSQSLSVQVFDEDPKLRLDNEYNNQTRMSSITVTPEGDNIFPVTSGCIYNLEGTIIIDLYNNTLLIGSIWLFDSNSITSDHQNTGNEIDMALENGALIKKEGDIYTLDNPPLNIIENNVLTFNIVQLLTSSSPGSTISSSSKINLISKGNGMTRRDTYKSVKSLKLQIYSDNDEAWSQYYSNNNFISEEETVKGDIVHSYEYNVDDVSLMLYHSCVEIDIL